MSPTGDATDVGVFSPLLLKEPSAGFWVKPYASFENIPLKNITSPTEETYFDISFLYTEVIAHKITDIYAHKTADGACLLAIIMVMDNQHYIAIGNDFDNPRMEIFTTVSAMEQALQQWEQEA